MSGHPPLPSFRGEGAQSDPHLWRFHEDGACPTILGLLSCDLGVVWAEAPEPHGHAILDLTLFAYACEAFVGVAPSMALLRHYFYARACKKGWMGGGVTFCFRPNIKAAGYPEINIKSKWEEWRAGWFLVEVPAPSPLFDEPTEVVTDQPS